MFIADPLIYISSHKYKKFLGPDGNYKLQRKNKRDDPDDVALNKGNTYFVDTAPYKKYLSLVGTVFEVSDSCSKLVTC